MTESALPPRVLIIMPEHWRRALLRGALREVGYDAIGASGVAEARLVRPALPDRSPVGLMIVDQTALATGALTLFVPLRERHGRPPTILLARATVEPPEGPWARVLRRPVSIEDIVTVAEALLPLSHSARRPVD